MSCAESKAFILAGVPGWHVTLSLEADSNLYLLSWIISQLITADPDGHVSCCVSGHRCQITTLPCVSFFNPYVLSDNVSQSTTLLLIMPTLSCLHQHKQVSKQVPLPLFELATIQLECNINHGAYGSISMVYNFCFSGFMIQCIMIVYEDWIGSNQILLMRRAWFKCWML